MKKNRLYIRGLILCSILILPLVSIVVLQLWQVYLSRSANERMDPDSIQTVVVPESKVIWKEKGREVTIEGAYFDLVSFDFKDGMYTLTGVFDEEETAVAHMLEQGAESEMSVISLLIMVQFFAAMVFYMINFSLNYVRDRKYAFLPDFYKFLYIRVIISPPRFA